MMPTTSDPKIRKGFEDILDNTNDPKTRAVLIAAEQAIIGYYYDMLCAMMVRNIKVEAKLDLPDQAPMKKAVTELNRACANLKVPFLFKGTVTSPIDLFTFASGIAVPAAA